MDIPPLIKILFFLFIGLAGLVFFTERNPVHLTPERQALVGKLIMVLFGISVFALMIKSCSG